MTKVVPVLLIKPRAAVFNRGLSEISDTIYLLLLCDKWSCTSELEIITALVLESVPFTQGEGAERVVVPFWGGMGEGRQRVCIFASNVASSTNCFK